MKFPRGTIACFPEDRPCYCEGYPPHWHAIERIFDGTRWLDYHSQAALDLLRDLKREHGNHSDPKNFEP